MNQYTNHPLYTINKIKGMLIGIALGDVSGAMHEFKNQTKQSYQKYFSNYKDSIVRFRFCSMTIESGMVTDDTEMTMCLFNHIIDNKWNYNKNDVILEYIKWANNTKMLGRNTRYLFKNIKTIKGYQNRLNKINKDKMQSNGSLMRASPLALLDKNTYYNIDCNITNPNKINRKINRIHINCLKILLNNGNKPDIIKYLQNITTDDRIIKKVINDILHQNTHIDYNSIGKGWVITSFYLAYRAFLNFDKYSNALKWLIVDNPKTDTDTNSSICGSLFGALLGYNNMLNDKILGINIKYILAKNKCLNILKYL